MEDHQLGAKIYHEYHRFRVYGFSRNFESDCPIVWGEFPDTIEFSTLCQFATVVGISCTNDGNLLGRTHIIETIEDYLWDTPKPDLNKAIRGFKADARNNPRFPEIFERVVNRKKHLHRIAAKYPKLVKPTVAKDFTLHSGAGGVSVGGIATQKEMK